MSTIFVGIFASESGIRFLQILESSCYAMFSDLHSRISPWDEVTFQACLCKISGWGEDLVLRESARVERLYCDVAEVFRRSFQSFVLRTRERTKSGRLEVNPPPLPTFLHEFWKQLAQSHYMKSGAYFSSMSLLDKRLVCMDACRDAMIVFNDDVHVIEQTEVAPDDSVSNVGSPVFRASKVYQVASTANSALLSRVLRDHNAALCMDMMNPNPTCAQAASTQPHALSIDTASDTRSSAVAKTCSVASARSAVKKETTLNERWGDSDSSDILSTVYTNTEGNSIVSHGSLASRLTARSRI